MKIAAVTTVVAMLLAACSTAPRDFTPTLVNSGSTTTQAQADLTDCQQQVASGRRSNFNSGRTTSVVAGSAVGVGAGMVTGAGAASGAGMLSGAAGAAGLATGFVIAAPIAIVVISKSIRSRKEREIKTATASCLQERGYTVSDWERTPKRVTAK